MAIADYLSGIERATTGEKTDLSNAAKDLATLQEGSGSLPAKLKEALNTKLNNNRDIIEQQADTMGTYFNAGPTARAKYADVWDPFKKAQLVAEERTMALRPYDVLSNVLENRMGSVADIVTAGVQGWQGLMDAAGTKVDLAKTNMATKLQAYLSAVGQQEQADQIGLEIAKAKEASRQFEASQALEKTKMATQDKQFQQELATRLKIAGMSSGGSGGGSTSSADIGGLAQYLFDNNITDAASVAALTNDKNVGAVTTQLIKLKAQAAAEKKIADEKNAALDREKAQNGIFAKAGNWISNYFNTHTYTPTIYGGVFEPKK